MILTFLYIQTTIKATLLKNYTLRGQYLKIKEALIIGVAALKQPMVNAVCLDG